MRLLVGTIFGAISLSVVLTVPISAQPDQIPSGTGVVRAGTGRSGPGKMVRVTGRGNVERSPTLDQVAKPGTPEYSIRQLEQKTGNAFRGEIVPVTDPALAALFGADLHWFILRYRSYPVAFAINPPLSGNNIIVLDKCNKILDVMSDEKAAEQYFKQKVHDVRDAQTARQALLAWLRLEEELHQDAFYHFSIPDASIDVHPEGNNMIATGSAVVDPSSGNKGQIAATLLFNNGGHLERIDTQVNLLPGMRPICQSTKLLDKDPIVRKMAEQDLLIMGRDCKPYLDEQRKKVSPALRKEIDRVWARIIREGR